jgi:DNA-binding transcriptional LysR family regulator
LELRQLRYFRAVAETGTFTAAAERELVAQPALWKQVRDLERELGVTLFEQAGRRVRLTGNGALLLERAIQALEGAARIRALADDLKAGRSGQVVIACLAPHISRLLAAAVRDFNRDHPSVHVDLREHPGMSSSGRRSESPLLSELRTGLADLAVVEGEANEFESLRLYEVHVVVIVPEEHPWRRRRSIQVEQLRGVPLVVGSEGFMSRRLLERACRSAGFEPTIDRVSASAFSLFGMGMQGVGVAVAADDVPLAMSGPWPRIRAGGTALGETVRISWRRGSQPPAVQAFITTLRRVVR